MNKKTLNFILEHPAADTPSLLLGASRYPDIDMPTACRCIEARRKLAVKVPSWLRCGELLFPYPTALEQCSGEAAALYRQRFVSPGDSVADLTAGLGVDSYFLGLVASTVDSYEHNPVLYGATAHNLSLLHADNVTVHDGDFSSVLGSGRRFDLIYLDPDRRSAAGGRLFSVRECEPDITAVRERLFTITGRILVKVSPMADISALLELLPETSQVHVVSAGDECKEVLLLLERGFSGEARVTAADVRIAAGHIKTSEMTATLSEEKGCRCRCLPPEELPLQEGRFLSRPWRAIVKAGFLKLPAERFSLSKAGPDVHLYFSDREPEGFPGRVFSIDRHLPFSGRMLRSLKTICPAASVTARCFPLTSEQLRIRAHLKEDDRRHIFAFRTGDGRGHLLLCTAL